MGHHLILHTKEKAATNLPLLGNNEVVEAITMLEKEGLGMRMNLVPALGEGGEAWIQLRLLGGACKILFHSYHCFFFGRIQWETFSTLYPAVIVYFGHLGPVKRSFWDHEWMTQWQMLMKYLYSSRSRLHCYKSNCTEPLNWDNEGFC